MRVAVVGRGLIGAAAARHLALAGHQVALIGAEEPARPSAHAGPFASHWDEGRITRRLATEAFWARVSTASIDRYAEIEAASGIRFFTRAGAMIWGPAAGEFVTRTEAVRQETGIAAEVLEDAALARRFPWLNAPGGTRAFFEADAGHVSPRRLVAAQARAALRLGARLVAAPATAIRDTGAGVEVATPAGTIDADVALIAAGGHSAGLAPAALPLRVVARTVAFFEVDAAEAARLADMPSMVFRHDGPGGPYMLPPIRYPCGRILLKLGGDPEDRVLSGDAEIRDWFQTGGDGAVRDHLAGLMAQVIPDLAVRAVTMAPCMITYTATGRPLIGPVGPRLHLATGGNGAGAKCSDELGRLAAGSVAGHPPAGLGAETLTEGESA